MPSQPTLRCDDFFVAHNVNCSLRLGNGRARLFPAHWIADSNCGCDRLWFFDHVIVKNRRGTSSLEPNHHRQFCRSFTCEILPVTRPIRSDVSGVADWQQMEIGRVAHFIDNLVCRLLLSRDPVRIDGIYNNEITALAELAHDPQGVVKIAIDRDNFRAVREGLQ